MHYGEMPRATLGSSDFRSQVAMVTSTTKGKNARRNRACAEHTSGQGRIRTGKLFRSRDFVTSGEKSPNRADFAQLRVAHAQNILSDSARDWRYFWSRHFRSCAMVRSPARSFATVTWAVPIYYWHSLIPCLYPYSLHSCVKRVIHYNTRHDMAEILLMLALNTNESINQ